MTAIDMDAISKPISEESPCGDDLRDDVRFDSPYQTLKNLREDAMALERGNRSAMEDDGDADPGQLRSKWREVVAAAASILSESSKDIEVCALLIEGLVRTEGLSGLKSGFAAATTLVSGYWDDLHPRLDPDDPDSLEDRVAAFNGLDGAGQPGTVARFIPRLYVTDCGDDDFQSYQLEQAFQARASGSAEEDESANALGFDTAAIERAAQRTSTEFYQTMLADLADCEQRFADLDAAFTEPCGFNAPSTSTIREALETLGNNLRYLVGDRLAVAQETDDTMTEADSGDSAATNTAGGNAAAKGPIRSRSDAVNRLREVASYFRETEPHSPLSYSLENLVRWAGMPLDQLIAEWITDDNARERYRLMTGMGSEHDAGG